MIVRRHTIDIRIRRVNDDDYGEGFCDFWCNFLWEGESCTLFDKRLEWVSENPPVACVRCCDECNVLCNGLNKKTTEEEKSLYDN